VGGSPAWGWKMASTTLHHKRKMTSFEMLQWSWWENLEGNGPIGRFSHRCDYITVDLKLIMAGEYGLVSYGSG